MRKRKNITMATFAYRADKVPKLDGVITETLSILESGAVVHIRKFRDVNDVAMNNYSVDAARAVRFLHRLDSRYKLYKWKDGYAKKNFGDSIKKHWEAPSGGAGRYWSLVIRRGSDGEEELLVGREDPPHCKAIRKELYSLCDFSPLPRIFETK